MRGRLEVSHQLRSFVQLPRSHETCAETIAHDFEARNIRAFANVLVGGTVPIAFVGCVDRLERGRIRALIGLGENFLSSLSSGTGGIGGTSGTGGIGGTSGTGGTGTVGSAGSAGVGGAAGGGSGGDAGSGGGLGSGGDGGAGVGGTGFGGTAGLGAGGSGAGTQGASGAAAGGANGNPGEPRDREGSSPKLTLNEQDSGCTCSTPRSVSFDAAGLVLAVAGLLGLRRRRTL